MFSVISSGAVSYTHLDVYKRQIRDSQGKVLGVRILKEGTAVNVRALGGVVLATGGFRCV